MLSLKTKATRKEKGGVGFGREGGCAWGIKATIPKNSGLQKKAEHSWKAFPPMGEQVFEQSSPEKGRGLVAR